METTIDPHDYKKLLESIRLLYGYDFTEYAESSLKRRLTNFMAARNVSSLEVLGKMLTKDQRLFEEFVQELSVTVTEMFRNPPFYKSIREKIVKRLATYPLIRIWIAGCATGEEIYSMAILLREEGLLDRSLLYATDINQKSLQQAKEGIYSLDCIPDYTNNYQQSGGKRSFSEYYTANSSAVRFDQTLRQNVVFSPHNLATDKSFNEFQLIICRNVLMYFNRHLQNKVIDLFHESLCPFGFLGIGDKESLLFYHRETCFEEADRQQKIYRKREQ
jgi:chemotaxis protein methyltransferase CheR